MNFPKVYEEYSKLSTPELAEIMAGRQETESKANIARLIYEERQMEKQHNLDMALLTKQLRWIKFSAILNAISILVGAILGFFLAKL